MKLIKIFIFSLVIFSLVMGIFTYVVLHGRMYMDRVIAMSEDRTTLFIWDFNRTQILGFLYLHSYKFNIYLNGKVESTSLSFQSFSKNIGKHSNLLSYFESRDYETTKSWFQIQYSLDNKQVLNIDSFDLTAHFITKTDPNYLRYMSSGTGIITINSISSKLRILSDTIVSSDSSHARLSPGTKILGYMWGYWDDEWNMQYIDIAKVLKKWIYETYMPHSYLLSLDKENRSQKIFSLDVQEDASVITFTKGTWVILKANKQNLIKIGEWNDIYYYFSWNTWDGENLNGFLNLTD